MRNRERQLWTEFVRRMEERKDKKPRKPRAKKKPEPIVVRISEPDT